MANVFRPRKQVVYLDQNLLSNIAKAVLAKGAFKPELLVYRDLWNALLRLIEADQIACPTSEFHEAEALYSPIRLRNEIDRVGFALSGGLGFRSWPYILESQARRALYRYMNRDGGAIDCTWEEAFQSDPDAPGTQGRRKAIYPDRLPSLELSRRIKQLYPAHARRIASDVRSQGMTFDQRLDYETGAVIRKFFLDPLASSWERYFKAFSGQPVDSVDMVPAYPTNLFQLCLELGGDTDTFLRFLLSEQFKAIPFVHIFCSLHAAMITTSARPEPGDADDAMILATVVPYSDVVATDDAKKRLLERLGLNSVYGTSLFSAKRQQVANFLDLLGQLQTAMVGGA